MLFFTRSLQCQISSLIFGESEFGEAFPEPSTAGVLPCFRNLPSLPLSSFPQAWIFAPKPYFWTRTQLLCHKSLYLQHFGEKNEKFWKISGKALKCFLFVPRVVYFPSLSTQRKKVGFNSIEEIGIFKKISVSLEFQPLRKVRWRLLHAFMWRQFWQRWALTYPV